MAAGDCLQPSFTTTKQPGVPQNSPEQPANCLDQDLPDIKISGMMLKLFYGVC